MSSALLLIDEMGYDPMNREEASLFVRLVSYRCRGVTGRISRRYSVSVE